MGIYLDEYITNKQSENSKDKDLTSQNAGGRKDLLSKYLVVSSSSSSWSNPATDSLIENNMQSSATDGLVGLTQQQIIGNVVSILSILSMIACVTNKHSSTL